MTNELDNLKRLNRQLIALLESHDIDWRGHIDPQTPINDHHAAADDPANSNAEAASSSSNTDPKTTPTSTTLTPQ